MRSERGLTLVELIVAIVVLGVGLAGVLVAFQRTAVGSGSALVQQQLLAIAEGLLEEAQSRPFASVAGTGSGGCARDGFNDIDDYNGYATSERICAIDGSEVATLAGYSVSVTVSAGTLAGVASAKRIQVTASSRSDSLTLTGWRTAWAVP